MRLAVIADVHANLPALEAVLSAIDRADVARVICLGDMVGYNAEPASCLRLLRSRVDTFVAGNHDIDVACRKLSPGTGLIARDVQAWTRAQLDDEAIGFLSDLPRVISDPAGFVAAHGCYLNTLFYTGYVTGTMLEKNLVAIRDHPTWPKLAFCGHTHVPMVAWLLGGEVDERAADHPNTWPAEAEAVLVNPGSVGQPRDGDARASFALVDIERSTVTIERTAYDIERACRAIAAARLPFDLVTRLREGR